MKKCALFLLLSLSLMSCMPRDGEEELHLVPITNNPHIVPNHGTTGIPMPN